MPDWFAHGPFVLVLAAISAISLLPVETGTQTAGSPLVSNLLHLPAYALLGLAACRSLGPLRHRPRQHLLAVLALVTFAGGVIEILQPLVGRYASLGDMALNLIGTTCAWAAWYFAGGAQRTQRA